jgi:hypothetical protein
MRGCLVFIGGYIAGFVSVLLLIMVMSALTTRDTISSYSERSVEGKSTTIISEVKESDIKLFAAPTDCVSTSDFKIKEVLDEYYAIAEEVEYDTVLENYYTRYNGIKVVIKSEEKNKYFDEQIIKMPAGKCMRQIGVYTKYSNTYPVVKISE